MMIHCILRTGWQFSGLAAAVMVGSLAQAAEPAAQTIEAQAGKNFTIALESNRTTGYGWQLAKPVDTAVVKEAGNSYQVPQPDPNKEPMVGAGGKEVWTFKAVKAGKTTISFKYVRPWEKDQPPAKTAHYEVVVK